MLVNNSYLLVNFSNETKVCSSSITDPAVLPFSESLVIMAKLVHSLYFICLFLLGTSLNGLVFTMIVKFKRLQTLSFAIALQVVLLDFFLSVVICLPAVTSVAANRWLFGKAFCVIIGLVSFSAKVIRTLLMFGLVVDRFLSVYCPFFYPRHSLKLITCLSLLFWLLPCAASLLGVPGILDCYTFVPTLWYCGISSQCNRTCDLYAISVVFIIAVPTCISSVILYFALYMKARKFQRVTATTTDLPEANNDTFKKNMRSAMTFFLLFVSLFAVTVPPTIGLTIIDNVQIPSDSVVYMLQTLLLSCISLLVVIDPIVILRNKDVAEVMAEMKGTLIRKFRPHAQE